MAVFCVRLLVMQLTAASGRDGGGQFIFVRKMARSLAANGNEAPSDTDTTRGTIR
jgi:hypothetical protein